MSLSFADLASLASHLDEPIVFVDAGCRWGFADAWSQFGRQALIVGFDPDPDECERLQAAYRDDAADVRLVPLGLGATTGPGELYVTVFPACSSLYPPNMTALARHPGLAIQRLERTDQVDLVALDDWAATEDLDRVDALKLDTQGSELDILQGGTGTLETVRMLEVEVEFNRLYEGQPLFGDVDEFLRQQGFELWRIEHMTHYGIAGADIGVDLADTQDYVGGVNVPEKQHRVSFTARGGQLYFADAFFLRSDLLTQLDQAGWQESLRDACIAAAFGFLDLAELALSRTLAAAPMQVAQDVEATLAHSAA
jgi:FkbM family methyltransferase